MRSLVLLALAAPVAASAQDSCSDILRYGEHRASDTFAIRNVEDEAMGQAFEAPAPVTVTGIEAAMYFDGTATCSPGNASCVDGGGSFSVRASVYALNNDGLPTGQALVSADSTLACVCDVDDVADIRRLIDIPDTVVSGSFGVVVENTDADADLRVLINDFTEDDGEGENLGLYLFDPSGGRPELRWFNALDVGIGGVIADADVYVRPQVEYDIDGAFVPVTSDGDPCPNAGTTIEIDAPIPILQHRMYNGLVRDGDVEEASQFTFGDVSRIARGFSVDHTYGSSGGFVVQRTLRQVGWTQECQVATQYAFNAEVFQFYDCDGDGVTGAEGGSFCGDPVVQNGQCGGSGAVGFSTLDGGDCDDDNLFTFPGAPEECNGEDNDCSGVIDDGLDPLPADPVFGECIDNTLVCVDGDFVPAPDNVQPAAETCDGRDEDCDGTADEGIPAIASDNTVGACSNNIQICSGGGFVDAPENVLPSDEVCDGVDNDCDASTADGADEPSLGERCDGDDSDSCRTGTLECSGGSLLCTDDPATDDCDPDTEPDTEPDTDPDPDTDDDSDPDTDEDSDSDVDSDRDTDGEPGDASEVRCGCAASTGPAGMAWMVVLGLVALRRRRA